MKNIKVKMDEQCEVHSYKQFSEYIFMEAHQLPISSEVLIHYIVTLY